VFEPTVPAGLNFRALLFYLGGAFAVAVLCRCLRPGTESFEGHRQLHCCECDELLDWNREEGRHQDIVVVSGPRGTSATAWGGEPTFRPYPVTRLLSSHAGHSSTI
jgi:hypothetical protein